jgi:patatin-like phospholipase/acyl hydrolase
MDGAVNYMIDGGVWANNPAQVALAEARSIFGDVHDFLVVSVGTGETERRVQAQGHHDWSVSGWLRNGLVSMLMDAPTSAIDKQMREERNVSYHRLQMDLKRREAHKPAPNDDLDDSSPENIARLEERADEFLHNNRDYMCKLKTYFSYHALPNYQELLDEATWAAKKREESRDPIMGIPPRDEFYNTLSM